MLKSRDPLLKSLPALAMTGCLCRQDCVVQDCCPVADLFEPFGQLSKRRPSYAAGQKPFEANALAEWPWPGLHQRSLGSPPALGRLLHCPCCAAGWPSAWGSFAAREEPGCCWLLALHSAASVHHQSTPAVSGTKARHCRKDCPVADSLGIMCCKGGGRLCLQPAAAFCSFSASSIDPCSIRHKDLAQWLRGQNGCAARVG